MTLAVPDRRTRWASAWRSDERRSPIRRTGDLLTLFAVLLSPLYGLGVAGLGWCDVVFLVVILVRGVQFVVEGLPVWELRRHSVLLVVFGLFAIGGTISGFAIRAPVPWDFARIVIASLGSAAVVAFYGWSERQLLPLVRAFSLGCLILALSGLFGEQTNGRATGFSIHPNGLAHSCVMGAAAAALLAVGATHRWERRLWTVTSLLAALAVVLVTGSRGSFVGLFLGIVTYLALSGNRRLRVAALAITYVAVLGVFTGAIHLPESNPISRFESGGGGSNQERADALRENLDEISESPVNGTGWHNITRVHVVYLQGWVGGGIVCAFSLLLLGAAMFVLPFGQTREHLPLACGAVAVALAWMFTNVLTTRDQWIYLALAFRICDTPVLAALRRWRRPEVTPA